MKVLTVFWKDIDGKKHITKYEEFKQIKYKREFDFYHNRITNTIVFIMEDTEQHTKTTATFFEWEIESYTVEYINY